MACAAGRAGGDALRALRGNARRRPGRHRRHVLRSGRRLAPRDAVESAGSAARSASKFPSALCSRRPCVAALGERLRDAHAARAPLGPRARRDPLPLSFVQRRLWFLHRMEGATRHLHDSAGVCGCAARSTARPDRVSDDVVTRHESLRTIFSGDAGHAAAGDPRSFRRADRVSRRRRSTARRWRRH